MGSTKTNTNTDSWDNMLIHQAIRAHAGWGYLESSLIWSLTNYEQAGNATELPAAYTSRPFWLDEICFQQKRNQSYIIEFVFSTLEIFGSVLMVTCFWLPGYNFSFRKNDCSTITASTDQGQFSFTHSFFKWKLWFTLLIAEGAFEKIQAYTLQLCVFSTDDFHKYFLHSLSCLHMFLFHFGATLRLLLGLKMPQ